jgi:ribonuclease P/MRP protein subunit POP5
MRLKNRYHLVRLHWEDEGPRGKFDKSGVYRAIRDSIALNFGDMGAASVQRSLNVMYFCPLSRLCMVRAARDHSFMVRQAMTFITMTQKTTVRFVTLAVCGTTRTLKRALLLQHQRVLQHTDEQARDGLLLELQTIEGMELT